MFYTSQRWVTLTSLMPSLAMLILREDLRESTTCLSHLKQTQLTNPLLFGLTVVQDALLSLVLLKSMVLMLLMMEQPHLLKMSGLGTAKQICFTLSNQQALVSHIAMELKTAPSMMTSQVKTT